jgi:hypothetical protein
MSFGLAAIGVLFGAAMQAADSLVAFLAFDVCLPMLSALVLSYWVAAQERIARASHYLSGTEQRLKKAGGFEGEVSWEAWIRWRPMEVKTWSSGWNAEMSGMLLFTLIWVGSLATGSNVQTVPIEMKVGVGLVSGGISILLTLHVYGRYKRCRHWLSSTFAAGSYLGDTSSEGRE